MSGKTAIGYVNHVQTTGTTITATSEVSGMSGSNVAGNIGSSATAWQTLAGVTTATLTITLNPASSLTLSLWQGFGLFRTNLSPSASIVLALGGVTVATLAGPTAGYGQVVSLLSVPSASIGATSLTIAITDSTNTDGHLNIPMVFAGPLFIPEIGHSYRSNFGREDRTDVTTSLGGQEYAQSRWSKRFVTMDFDAMVSAEIIASAMEIDRLSRLGGNILAVRDRTSTVLAQEAVFGRLLSTAAFGYPTNSASILGWSAKVTERL